MLVVITGFIFLGLLLICIIFYYPHHELPILLYFFISWEELSLELETVVMLLKGKCLLIDKTMLQ
jgi:hypothetical protein